jgi:hypothetical protein
VNLKPSVQRILTIFHCKVLADFSFNILRLFLPFTQASLCTHSTELHICPPPPNSLHTCREGWTLSQGPMRPASFQREHGLYRSILSVDLQVVNWKHLLAPAHAQHEGLGSLVYWGLCYCRYAGARAGPLPSLLTYTKCACCRCGGWGGGTPAITST